MDACCTNVKYSNVEYGNRAVYILNNACNKIRILCQQTEKKMLY